MARSSKRARRPMYSIHRRTFAPGTSCAAFCDGRGAELALRRSKAMASQQQGNRIIVSGDGLTVADVVAVARNGARIALPDTKEFWDRVNASCRLNKEVADA